MDTQLVSPPVLLATSDGRWVLADSPEFLAALGDPDPDYDAPGYAVRNLGFIQVQTIGQALTEVQLHPRNVQLPALLAVQQQLLTSPVRLFRIKFFDAEWRSETWVSPEQVIARLSELCAPAFSPPVTERFWVEPQEFGAIFRDDENQLRPVAQKWRVSFGHFDPNVLTIAMQNQMLSRLMIVGVKPHGNEPEWRFIGSGQRWLDESFHLTGVGQKTQDLPDKEYGQWVSEFYKSVAATGRPRYDRVTAVMQYDSEPGHPRRVTHYDRLLLPWKTPSSEVFVTSCARLIDDSAKS
ncbi:MAG TPA: hypothetical protein VGG57_05105 [Stellaceae bacterium]